MMVCINCGQSFSAELERCPHCGVKRPITEETRFRMGAEATLLTNSSENGEATLLSNGSENTEATLLSSSTESITPAKSTTVIAYKEISRGQVLGNRYEIQDYIGGGGMGTIYSAKRIHIGDTVAVKVLRPEVVNDTHSRERFQREARAAARLHHPNAVVVHDFGQEPDGTTFIVMELLEGRSLRDYLNIEHRIEPKTAIAILKQACAAIEAAHRLGIIHRDIKPDNIILLDSHDGVPHVKILDFGIAKLLDKTNDTGEIDPTLTQVGTVIGTPNYMSPEQCQGEHLDARSDVYSLGVVMYEMLTGVQPFTGKNSTAIVIKHVTEKPRPLLSLRPEIPASIERVVLQALEKKPEARQQSAIELAKEFEQALKNQEPAKPVAQPAPAPQMVTEVDTAAVRSVYEEKSKMPLIAGIGGISALLAGGLIWWVFFSSPKPTPQPPPTSLITAQVPPQNQPKPSPIATAIVPQIPEGMVVINGGEFKMGRDDGTDIDQPSHPITVKPFYLDINEVTNAAYKIFTDETKHPVPPLWKDGTFPSGKENHPVTDVTWEDANAYAKWAGKRLPTEEEWEYAARGSDGRLYPWGETYKPGGATANDEAGISVNEIHTAPVGSYPEGKSPFGIFDLSGNAFEWTASTLKAYPGGMLPTGMENYRNLKVIRGGSWRSDPKQITGTYRRGWPATRKDWPDGIAPDRIDYTAIGFRCAKDVPQP